MNSTTAVQTNLASGKEPRSSKVPRWYLAYFLLAFFDVLTVSASLLLSHSLIGIHSGSVEVNEVWAQRLEHLAVLRQLAGAVNAPGNDVFDSHDVAFEAGRMQTAIARFQTVAKQVRDDLNTHDILSEHAELLNGLDQVGLALDSMVAEAQQIFAFFRQGHADQAGQRMATMDRKYAEVNAAFARLEARIRALQKNRFEVQKAVATDLQSYEMIIANFILVMIGGAIFYGNKIRREMLRAGHARSRIEQQLRDSATRFEGVLAAALDAIFVIDPEGRILDLNPAAEQLSGYARAQVTGLDLVTLISPPGLLDDYRRRLLGYTFSDKGTLLGQRGDITLLRSDGTEFPAELAAVEVSLESGPLIAINVRDITERKTAEQAVSNARARLDYLVTSSPTVVYSTQVRGARACTYASDNLEQVLGYRAAEMMADANFWINHLHPDDRATVAAQFADQALQKQGVVEYRIRHADDSYRWIADAYRVTCDGAGQPVEIVGGWTDITAHKAAEEAMAFARDEALRTTQAKSQFLANMSHEIRTPMNGVIGMTELILRTDLSEQQRRFAETVYRSAEGLLSVINDILDFSKIEAGKLDFDNASFDLRNLVEDVADLFAERTSCKGIELTCSVPSDVSVALIGDPGRLRQVLTNLLGNAIKFTKQGEVGVKVTAIEDTQDVTLLRFEVRDTGVGIDPAHHDRIFDSFAQADGSTTREYGGSGLGLAISKRLVNLLGGQIGVDSITGQGSNFWFELTFKKQAKSNAMTSKVPNVQLHEVHILVVDDNATNRDILHHQLLAWGIRHQCVDGGAEALACLRAAHATATGFDLAILDMHMPGMNGIDLARTITADPELTGMRLVMLSSIADVLDADERKAAGIQFNITKPVRQSELYNTLVSAIATRQLPLITPRTVVTEKAVTRLQGHVLLAEDSVVNQAVATEMLQALGCKVSVANNGKEALAAIANAVPDIILMDCQMPEMDGYAATAAIRRRESADESAVRRIPIIALTANALAGDRERCLAAGMDDYLSKPFTYAGLARALAKWLSPTDEQKPAILRLPKSATPPVSDATPLDQQVLDDIRNMQGGRGRDILAKIVNLYFRESPQALSALRVAIAHRDPQAVYQIAHRLKSSSAQLGARTLAKVCKDLEEMGRSSTITDQAETLFEQLVVEHGRALAALGREVEAQQQPSLQLTSAQPVPKVVVADDDDALRMLISESLSQAGCEVTGVVDGASAIVAFKKIQPDIVLLDVNMPGLDGFATCAELRRLPGGDYIPIVMTTGLDDVDSINRAYEAGATDFITKPITLRILSQRVRYMWRATESARALRRSEEKHKALVAVLPDMIFTLDTGGKLLDFKPARDPLLAVKPTQPGSQSLGDILPADIGASLRQHTRLAIETGQTQEFEFPLTLNERPHEFDARVVASGNDEATVIVRDITERKRAESRIRNLAYFDGLTGLPNRMFFLEHLTETIKYAASQQQLVAVLFIDLDHFKGVNDTLGHSAGDALLRTVAERLQGCVRTQDVVVRDKLNTDLTKVSRLGGDEFTILLSDLHAVDDAAGVAQRILTALTQPVIVGNEELFVSASIGIAVYPLHGEAEDLLLKHADTAMYHAKQLGRNNYQFYSSAMSAKASARLSMEGKLRRALERDEFVLHYQPQVLSVSGEVVGVEALLRWRHPDLGLVSPADFIPVAEETGLIVPIGEWVLYRACAEAKSWPQSGLPPLRLGVNLSRQQLARREIVTTLRTVLASTGLDPNRLELELTEDSVIENLSETIVVLNQIKDLGLSLAMDDFGTGYSSLSCLKRMPLDCLKIDRAFVRDITDDPNDATVVAAILAMAHSLKLRVVAEGVETQAQQQFLQVHQCGELQGYYFSRPLPIGELIALLRTRSHTLDPAIRSSQSKTG
jgi:diguanylate cyclase (GGDEF)-like protein/PAS domain S-box-containing protein